MSTAAGKLGSRILTVYGGRAYEPQIEALKQGVDVIVGTPGRLLDLVKQKHLDLSQIGTLVLDEADRMLDLGFLPDIERIIKLIPAERQTMLFSATMPGEIVAPVPALPHPPHPRAGREQRRRGRGDAADDPVRLARAPDGQDRDRRPPAAVRGPRAHDGLL